MTDQNTTTPAGPEEATRRSGGATAASSPGRSRSEGFVHRMAQLPPASAVGAMQNPAAPPRRTVDAALTRKRMITVGMLLPLFMMFVMPMLMVGTSVDVTPRDMKVAVIGTGAQVSDLAQQLTDGSAGDFDAHRVDTVDDGRSEVRTHDARAAYDPATGTLYTAGANGRQVNAAVTQLFTPVAQRAQKQLVTEDVAAVAEDDPNATTITYLALGAILGGFMTGVVSSLMPAGTRLRVLLWFLMPAVVATGMVVYGWAVFGIFSGSAFVPWCMLYMLCLSCVTVTTGLMLVLGPLAMPLCIFLMPLLGLSASGLTTPLDMVGGFYGWIHGWLYAPQGVAAIRDAVYFQDVSLAAPVWIMIAWIAGGIALAVLGTLRQKRRHLFAVLSEREETTTAVAAAAASV
ncbi:ABC transporter permease [Kocuria sp.]|uniref:ABC transporter permease n=1 Tax=Kocuria sp. TaxID=1871328 RepID=UPI0026DADDAD|nr:ABC transporter permease [Kocuria sp.]MDO4917990.1 ABC transporter permease [Kocuria sp.]